MNFKKVAAMMIRNRFAATLAVLLAGIICAGAEAEHHRATHLGNPATRFAPPMNSPADLRARFADPQLHPDFVEVLRQWGWTGDLNDFFTAGLTNEIVEWQITVGDTMPFMSSREAHKAICLRNVTWAGTEPIHAYAFVFRSNGRVYRCIVPRPCSNFFVVDLGPEPKAGLAIDCETPGNAILGRPFKVSLNVRNTGNIPGPLASVVLPVPAGAVVTATTDGGMVTNNSVVWTIADLPVNTTKQVYALMKGSTPGILNFSPSAGSAAVASVQSSCATEIMGVPAILLEKSDDPDPVAVGDTTTYTVKVTNQGTADDSNVQIVVTIASELAPVSTSAGTIDGQTVTLPPIPKLPAKQAATYTIIAKGVSAGDGRTVFTLSSDMLTSPISAEESTTVY